MANYWVVGASFEGGTDHKDKEFIEKGIWMLGWDEKSGKEKHQFDNAKNMQPGDRIAIKRVKGGKDKGIIILHVGVIKDVIPEVDKVVCTVNWAATNLDRYIGDSKGCYRAVNGPFTKEKESDWIKEIFCI